MYLAPVTGNLPGSNPKMLLISCQVFSWKLGLSLTSDGKTIMQIESKKSNTMVNRVAIKVSAGNT